MRGVDSMEVRELHTVSREQHKLLWWRHLVLVHLATILRMADARVSLQPEARCGDISRAAF